MNPGEAAASLDAEQAAFVSGAVSINVASRDANFVPSAARAFGCRVDAQDGRVIVFLPPARAAGVLDDLRAGGPVSVVFSRPTTHRTLQVKGAGATVRPLARGERDVMLAYARCFGEEIRALDWDEAFARAMVSGADEDAVAVCFAPLAVFDQTPGPGAGRRVSPGP